MRRLRWFAAYLLLAGGMALLLYRASGLRDYTALAERGVAAEGVVVHADCQGRHGYRYTFQAAGRWINGSAGGHCSGMLPGDRVAVTYLPDDPQVNSAGDVRERRNTSALLGAVVVLLFPLLLLLRFRRMRSRRHRRGRAAGAGGDPR